MAKQAKTLPPDDTKSDPQPDTQNSQTKVAVTLPTFDDPNSPNAMKAKAEAANKEEAGKPQLEKYIVLKTQMIEGEWVSPSDDPENPTTVEMLEVQSRFRVLNGKLKKADSKD